MKDKEVFHDCYFEITEIIIQHTISKNFKECTQALKYPEVGTDKKTGAVRKIDMGGVKVIDGWMKEGFEKAGNLLNTMLDNYSGG